MTAIMIGYRLRHRCENLLLPAELLLVLFQSISSTSKGMMHRPKYFPRQASPKPAINHNNRVVVVNRRALSIPAHQSLQSSPRIGDDIV